MRESPQKNPFGSTVGSLVGKLLTGAVVTGFFVGGLVNTSV
jgi:hypothetical protein